MSQALERAMAIELLREIEAAVRRLGDEILRLEKERDAEGDQAP